MLLESMHYMKGRKAEIGMTLCASRQHRLAEEIVSILAVKGFMDSNMTDKMLAMMTTRTMLQHVLRQLADGGGRLLAVLAGCQRAAVVRWLCVLLTCPYMH